MVSLGQKAKKLQQKRKKKKQPLRYNLRKLFRNKIQLEPADGKSMVWTKKHGGDWSNTEAHLAKALTLPEGKQPLGTQETTGLLQEPSTRKPLKGGECYPKNLAPAQTAMQVLQETNGQELKRYGVSETGGHLSP